MRDLERALSNLSLTNLRTVIGSMSLDDILIGSQKEDIYKIIGIILWTMYSLHVSWEHIAEEGQKLGNEMGTQS